MKVMSLRDIQLVSVEILKELNDFCQKNNINYSLGYGALIGAVRHKGCIPWDDDIDVIMPRPDYERFIKNYKSHDGEYKVFAPELGNCFHPISRMCEMKRTNVLKSYQWADEQIGVFIDIFPLDEQPSDKGEMIKKIKKQCLKACLAARPISKHNGFKKNLKILLRRIIYGRNDRSKEIEKYIKEISSLSYENADIVCNFGSPYFLKDSHSKKIFEKYIRVPFEGIEVSIIESYNVYLQNIYGDYMKLPSEDKRIPSHTYNCFFWV